MPADRPSPIMQVNQLLGRNQQLERQLENLRQQARQPDEQINQLRGRNNQLREELDKECNRCETLAEQLRQSKAQQSDSVEPRSKRQRTRRSIGYDQRAVNNGRIGRPQHGSEDEDGPDNQEQQRQNELDSTIPKT